MLDRPPKRQTPALLADGRSAPADPSPLVMPSRRWDAALGAAVALAAPAAVVAAILWPGGRPPPPSPVVAATLVPAPPDPPEPPAPIPAPPPPPDVVVPQPPLPEIRTRAALQTALHIDLPPRPVVAAPPSPETGPVSMLPPPPPSPAAQASFEQRVLGAVQAAADAQMTALPAVARMMRLSGRARVTIACRDGTLLEARLEQSAGTPMLDAAAMAAVRSARYPQPPPELAGRTLTYALWIQLAVR